MTFSSCLFGSFVMVFVAGCSGSSAGVDLGSSGASTTTTPSGGDAASLFDAPSGTVTPDTIFGVWGGVDDETSPGTEIDVRLKLTTTSIANALRCTLTATQKASGIVGVSVAARNTEDDLVFLESKNDSYDDGTIRCSTSVAPREVKRCAEDVQPGFEQNCFELDGTHLTLYGDDALEKLDLVKLSD